MDDSFRKYCHFVAPSFKLELARFSAKLRIQDGAKCGNMKYYIRLYLSLLQIPAALFYSLRSYNLQVLIIISCRLVCQLSTEFSGVFYICQYLFPLSFSIKT